MFVHHQNDAEINSFQINVLFLSSCCNQFITTGLGRSVRLPLWILFIHMQSARKYYDYLIVSFVVIQDICTRLAPEVRTSSTTRVWGRYRDLLPGKSPPCLHLFPPHLRPCPETMATTRIAPSFSHMCPAQDMEPTSPWRPKPSSSLFSSRSEPIQVRSL